MTARARRCRKVSYFVCDWPEDGTKSHWWCGGKWVTAEHRGKRAMSSDAYCKTKRRAIRVAKQLRSLGGVPLISQHKRIKSKRHVRGMWLPGCKPTFFD